MKFLRSVLIIPVLMITFSCSDSKPNIHDSLFKKLSNWEKSLIEPNWIENKNWNIVTEMIYQDLMSNKEIRAFSPKDLN
jgi:hypothetical protein